MKPFGIIVALTTLGIIVFTGWVVVYGLTEGGMAMLALSILGLPAALLAIAGVYATRSVWRGGRSMWVAGWLALVGLGAIALGDIGSVVAWLTTGQPLSIEIAGNAVQLSYGRGEPGPGADLGAYYLYPQERAFLATGVVLMAISAVSAVVLRRRSATSAPNRGSEVQHQAGA